MQSTREKLARVDASIQKCLQVLRHKNAANSSYFGGFECGGANCGWLFIQLSLAMNTVVLRPLLFWSRIFLIFKLMDYWLVLSEIRENYPISSIVYRIPLWLLTIFYMLLKLSDTFLKCFKFLSK